MVDDGACQARSTLVPWHGRPVTEKTRKKMSESHKRLWQDPNHRELQRISYHALHGRKHGGAFSTIPGDDPPIDDFDNWTYG